MKLTYIAAGFGVGLVLYPWVGSGGGTLTLGEEAGRQLLLLGITLFMAGHLSGSPTYRRVPLWIPALIALVTCFVLRKTVLFDLPFVPGDEDEYLFQATIFSRGRVTAEAPALAHLFWAPGILIHNGQWFGHHQPGHSALLMLGQMFGVPWVIPPLATATTVFLLALTTQRLAGREAGLLAGILAMSSPMLLMTGATLVSESSSLLLVSMVFWLLITRPAGICRSAYLAGIAAGLLLNTRLLIGFGAFSVGMILSDWSTVKRMLPGVLGGLAIALVHNTVTTGAPWVFPFQLYEPNALGFHERFGIGAAIGHLVRNLLLLNFWLLGWPISFLLLKRGTKETSTRLKLAGWIFVIWIALAYHVYWHPGQVATGPLRFHEATFPLLLFSALGWRSAQRTRSVLARYVPLAIAFAHMGFVPVREAVLARFVREAQEERRALETLKLDDKAVLLCKGGNLFHYPVNDPWLRAEGEPVFLWADDPVGTARLFPARQQIWLQPRCRADSCSWRLSTAPCGNQVWQEPKSEPTTQRRSNGNENEGQ